ncbi:MAG: preprotein translocase subunit SecE [Stellaceae bacterium]
MAKTTPLEFLRQVRQEVGRVTWPSRKETTVTTAMVFAMVIIAALFFFLVDEILARGVQLVLGLGS